MYANNISTVFTPEGKQKTFSLKVPPFFLRMAKVMSAQKCKCFLLKKKPIPKQPTKTAKLIVI